MHPHPDEVSFTPTHLSKQSRQGRPLKDFFFPSFKQNLLLCPVTTLQAYLERTKNCRGQVTKVLIGTIKPHKAVAPSTIARWLKTMLECAGIDTNIFSGHSTRGAASRLPQWVGSLQVTFLRQQIGARSQSSRNSITSHNRTHTLVERCCHQQASLRSEVATNNTLICETEPSEIEWLRP